MTSDSAARFSDRVPYYHRFRPRYPAAMRDLLTACGLTAASVVADIGAGTGLSAEVFLDMGCTVYAIEPNDAMRAASEDYYRARPNFQALDGVAEATPLAAHSVDWIAAGQAFHWFDPAAAKAEFTRILRPDGRVILFWNDRADHRSPFVDEYNAVLKRFDIEQGGTPRAKELLATDGQLSQFFAPHGFDEYEKPNPVSYDWDGLQGRALSSSYAPLHGQAGHAGMIAALRALYERYQVNGRVAMDYVTRIYIGRP